MSKFRNYTISSTNCGQFRTPLCSLSVNKQEDICIKETQSLEEKINFLTNQNSEMFKVIGDLVNKHPKIKNTLDCPPLYEDIGQSCFLHFSFVKVK